MSVPDEFYLGKSKVRIEPELAFICLHGSMTEEQIPQAIRIMRQLRDERGPIFILVDMRDGAKLPADMRRLLAQMLSDVAPAAIGVFGASVEQRAAHALLMGAVTGVSGHRPKVAYFQTEAEARAWLTQERQRTAGAPSGS